MNKKGTSSTRNAGPIPNFNFEPVSKIDVERSNESFLNYLELFYEDESMIIKKEGCPHSRTIGVINKIKNMSSEDRYIFNLVKTDTTFIAVFKYLTDDKEMPIGTFKKTIDDIFEIDGEKVCVKCNFDYAKLYEHHLILFLSIMCGYFAGCDNSTSFGTFLEQTPYFRCKELELTHLLENVFFDKNKNIPSYERQKEFYEKNMITQVSENKPVKNVSIQINENTSAKSVISQIPKNKTIRKVSHIKWDEIKETVWEQFNGKLVNDSGKGKCFCCLKQLDWPSVNIHGGHIIARSKLGEDNIDNVRICCGDCNSNRLKRGMAEQNMYGWMIKNNMPGLINIKKKDKYNQCKLKLNNLLKREIISNAKNQFLIDNIAYMFTETPDDPYYELTMNYILQIEDETRKKNDPLHEERDELLETIRKDTIMLTKLKNENVKLKEELDKLKQDSINKVKCDLETLKLRLKKSNEMLMQLKKDNDDIISQMNA